MRFALLAAALAAPLAAAALDYPATPRGDVIDLYHGTKIADPYRWLEDLDSAQTTAWVQAQNALSLPFLAALPEREALSKRLTSLWNYERFDVPAKAGGQYFYTRNDGLQNQAVLYVQKGSDAPRELLDPNRLSKDGTIALAEFEPSPDGRWLMYATAAAGSDWNEFRVRDVASGRDSPESLQRIKFSDASWTADSAGFYYSRYPDPPAALGDKSSNRAVFDGLADQKLYYHRVGAQQSEDRLVFEETAHPKWFVEGEVSHDSRYLIITMREGSGDKSRIYVRDLASEQQPADIVKLVDNFDDAYDFIGSKGSIAYFTTDREAPRRRVVSIDLSKPQAPEWKPVIAQSADTIAAVKLAGGKLVVLSLHDAASRLSTYTLEGKPAGELKLPGLGAVPEKLQASADDSELLFGYSSFNQPQTPYRADLKSNRVEAFRRLRLAFDPRQYRTEQVFYPSRDGTRIPMFISYKKGLKRNGRARAWLHGYGGFNIPKTPAFDVSALAWMERGGIYAVANLRGGGEYGEDWHLAGTRERKQNVFDDFVAAAGYLVKHDYTAYPRIAIWGRSNGGLLIGASVNQHPQLWGAAVATVGVMDMLRFHKFTVGYAWVGDYGSSDDAEGFDYLSKYSPLHTVTPGTHYPPTLITTGDHDDRVHPAHSFKYAATLQAAQAGVAPVLIRIDTRAGHGGGKPVSKVIEEESDKLAFMWHYTAGAAESPSSP
ncbi:MAG: prolyl oligopeptidase [Hydrocarboniphaga sp.]|uniref:prolyl oligopeptidase family serine peptidase n=1 Tax=Hydrocarboniphaga sp. TaxID=2033016 RepID=UPI00263090CA|nr:prolyl oligopeptidase family serine peptidase [Hydrocarboniphaga sp.]MDB5972929.1 prolyl oligopeptidase [Hydrocarboniphaga sp.]